MREKPDTFTLHKTGHFHFALTVYKKCLTLIEFIHTYVDKVTKIAGTMNYLSNKSNGFKLLEINLYHVILKKFYAFENKEIRFLLF